LPQRMMSFCGGLRGGPSSLFFFIILSAYFSPPLFPASSRIPSPLSNPSISEARLPFIYNCSESAPHTLWFKREPEGGNHCCEGIESNPTALSGCLTILHNAIWERCRDIHRIDIEPSTSIGICRTTVKIKVVNGWGTKQIDVHSSIVLGTAW
jgi:hypothetical protein